MSLNEHLVEAHEKWCYLIIRPLRFLLQADFRKTVQRAINIERKNWDMGIYRVHVEMLPVEAEVSAEVAARWWVTGGHMAILCHGWTDATLNPLKKYGDHSKRETTDI